MGSVNCSGRKSAADHVPSRPVLVAPHVESIKRDPRIQQSVVVSVEALQARIQPRDKQLQNEMHHASHRRPDRSNVPPRHQGLVNISDESDVNDETVAVSKLAQASQRGAPSRHQHSTPSPSPSSVNDVALYGGLNGAITPPRQAIPDDQAYWRDLMIDEFDEFDVNDAELARIMMEDFNRESQGQAAPRPCHPGEQLPSSIQYNMNESTAVIETRFQCIDQVLAVFPGICRDHISALYDTVSPSSDQLIAHILDKMEKGSPYPKAKDTKKTLKRKRNIDEDEEAARKYGRPDRLITVGRIRHIIRSILSMEFPETPMTFIDRTLEQCGHRLFSAYRVLEAAHRTFDPKRAPYNKIKHQRKTDEKYKEPHLERLIESILHDQYEDQQQVEVLRELQAVRRTRQKAEEKRAAEHQLELDEEANVWRAEAEGTMSECGCCFSNFPLNRMVHCDNEDILHWFCRGCARQNAETLIGNSKYQLCCMSMDGCDAGFSIGQRSQFLDQTTTIALERNEQEAVLRMAGIENLASCPFCPYAAEYPPIEIDREFRCEAPDCEKVSCRLCKQESHIPKSCEEHAKENGLSIRRQIEEAMSAALIRKCNKCSTPFVKEEGCNKMTCTRNGCYNVQCYVCSKSCSYDHFDDQRRGGKAGNCPLFESVEVRHDEEVRRAEKEALEKVRSEHPEYTEDDLKVKMSENVLKDDERRKINDPRARVVALQAAVHGNRDRAVQFAAPPPPAYAPPEYVLARQPVYQGRVVDGPGVVEGIFGEVVNDDYTFAGLWDDLPALEVGHPLPHQYQPAPQVLPHVFPYGDHGVVGDALGLNGQLPDAQPGAVPFAPAREYPAPQPLRAYAHMAGIGRPAPAGIPGGVQMLHNLPRRPPKPPRSAANIANNPPQPPAPYNELYFEQFPNRLQQMEVDGRANVLLNKFRQNRSFEHAR